MWPPHWAPRNWQACASPGATGQGTTSSAAATRQRERFSQKRFVSFWYLASCRLCWGKERQATVGFIWSGRHLQASPVRVQAVAGLGQRLLLLSAVFSLLGDLGRGGSELVLGQTSRGSGLSEASFLRGTQAPECGGWRTGANPHLEKNMRLIALVAPSHGLHWTPVAWKTAEPLAVYF